NLSRVEQGLNLSAAEGVGPERDMGDLAIEVTDGVGRAVGDRVGVLGIAAQEKVRVCAEDFDAAGGGTALGQDAVEIEIIIGAIIHTDSHVPVAVIKRPTV